MDICVGTTTKIHSWGLSLSKYIRICSTDTLNPGWATAQCKGPGTAETASVKCRSSYSGLPYWQGCCKYKGEGGWEDEENELARATSEEEAGAVNGERVIL